MIDADGTFRFDGVGPGSYRLSVSLPPPDGTWMMASVTLGGEDLLTSTVNVAPGQSIGPIVATATDRITAISGRLLDQAGHPMPDFYVLAYPVNRNLWTIGGEWLPPPARPGSDGNYRITGLLPGEYYLAAVTQMQPEDRTDPAFLDLLVPASLKITMGPGEKKVQDVTLAGGG